MAHYLRAARFAERLLELRNHGPFTFQMDKVEVTVKPMPQVLDGDVVEMKFSGDGLEVMRVDLTVAEPAATWRTHLFISAGPWGYGFAPEESYFLFVHDASRRKSHQIDLLSLLVEDHLSDRLVLTSQLRFPFKGGREARLRLTEWLEAHGIPLWDEFLVLGTDEDVSGILQNLIVVGLLKQHMRGHKVICSLAEDLPPKVTAVR